MNKNKNLWIEPPIMPLLNVHVVLFCLSGNLCLYCLSTQMRWNLNTHILLVPNINPFKHRHLDGFGQRVLILSNFNSILPLFIESSGDRIGLSCCITEGLLTFGLLLSLPWLWMMWLLLWLSSISPCCCWCFGSFCDYSNAEMCFQWHCVESRKCWMTIAWLST